MSHRSRTTLVALTATAALGPFAVVALAGAPTQAQTRAAVTVSIQAQGTDLSGEVRSRRGACRSEVPVVVVRQRGSRGGGNDERFASDTTGTDGSWSTGNTGTEGRFYAKVRGTQGCAPDTSPTITARR